MRVLVLGATGMLGHTVFEHFLAAGDHEVWGTVRGDHGLDVFTLAEQARLRRGVDVLDEPGLQATLDDLAPDVIINCIGVIKQWALRRTIRWWCCRSIRCCRTGWPGGARRRGHA